MAGIVSKDQVIFNELVKTERTRRKEVEFFAYSQDEGCPASE